MLVSLNLNQAVVFEMLRQMQESNASNAVFTFQLPDVQPIGGFVMNPIGDATKGNPNEYNPEGEEVLIGGLSASDLDTARFMQARNTESMKESHKCQEEFWKEADKMRMEARANSNRNDQQ